MIGKLCTLTLTAALLTGGVARAADNPPLCSGGAQTIFSCASTGGTISVYRGSGEPKLRETLVYRFGRSIGGAFSLTAQINSDGRIQADGPVRVLSRTLLYSGGGGSYLRFVNGKTDYVVFSTFVDGSESQGVAVNVNGQTTAVKYCVKPAVSTMNLRLFRELGVANDPDEFVFPQRRRRTP